MRYLSQLKKKDLSREICLLRVDFNIENMSDSLRLEAVLPTLEWLTKRNCRILIMSHRGRPGANGPRRDPSLSLRTALTFLSRHLLRQVHFVEDFDFKVLAEDVRAAVPGSVYLLENLRYLPGEEKNDAKLAKTLASLGTFYVNDAFAVSHRKNASVSTITRYLPSYAGLRFEKEYEVLKNAIKRPARPFVVIIGGAKTSDKMPLIKNLLKKADSILLGGGAANTLLAAKSIDVMNSVYDSKLIPEAKKMLKSKKIFIPADWLTEDERIVDIGPLTVEAYSKIIRRSKTVLWNGPLGYIEKSSSVGGSAAIAVTIAQSRAHSIVGGGETTQLIRQLHLENKFSFVSTAGGAMLEFLSGKKLPGIEALQKSS